MTHTVRNLGPGPYYHGPVAYWVHQQVHSHLELPVTPDSSSDDLIALVRILPGRGEAPGLFRFLDSEGPSDQPSETQTEEAYDDGLGQTSDLPVAVAQPDVPTED